MEIVGFDEIRKDNIKYVNSISEINNSFANELIIFKFDLDIIKFCDKNSVDYGVIVNDIKEAVLSNFFNAQYIIVESVIAKEIQDIANEYMFDSKILQQTNTLDNISTIAKNGIDGIIKQIDYYNYFLNFSCS